MKKLLLSTALVAATSVPVFAQNAEDMFRQQADPSELHASDFIGMRVYRTDGVESEAYEGVQDGWDDIGEINDVVFNREGSVEAVLIDIGGFLGIGENQVAVDMDSIQFVADSATPDQETDFFLVLNAPRGALEEAPIYGAMGGETAVDTAADAGEMSTSETGTHTGMSEGSDVADDNTEKPSTPVVGATESGISTGIGLSREGYVTVTQSDLVADELTGAVAYDTNDKRIGEVSELLMSANGKIESAVVDVGGFLGIGEKPVLLEMSKLDILRAEDGRDVRVYISMSEEELEGLPEYEQ